MQSHGYGPETPPHPSSGRPEPRAGVDRRRVQFLPRETRPERGQTAAEDPSVTSFVVPLDIETTGLDEDNGVILEIALAWAPGPDPTDVVDFTSFVIAHSEAELAALPIDDRVIDMHTTNGLFELCVGPTAVPISEVEDRCLSFLSRDPNLATALGRSVGGFDLRWIRKHMPRLFARFSRRVIDVTSCQTLAEDVVGHKIVFPEGDTHRALDDVAEAVIHYRQLRDMLAKRTP